MNWRLVLGLVLAAGLSASALATSAIAARFPPTAAASSFRSSWASTGTMPMPR